MKALGSIRWLLTWQLVVSAPLVSGVLTCRAEAAAEPPPSSPTPPPSSAGASRLAASPAPSLMVPAVATPPVSPTAAPSSSAPPQTSSSPGSATDSLCVEQLPAGKARPPMTEKFPARALAGHAAWLELEVEHGTAETVMPGGARLVLGGEQAEILERSGFILPDPEGPVRSSVVRASRGTGAVTTVRIPFVPLPKKPGKATFTLPALPIVVARASGESLTLCTEPHSATIDDPTASTPNATPRPNPQLLRQLEEWTALKTGLMVALLAILVGLLFAWLWLWWSKRERRPRPGPPPRPPWEVALEELSQVRRDNLIAQGRLAEHFDRVSDTVRKYLGARFGFDGLESTTAETLRCLRSSSVPVELLSSIDVLLAEADLVKFARRNPTEPECVLILDRADATVRSTLPREAPLATPPSLESQTVPTSQPSSKETEDLP